VCSKPYLVLTTEWEVDSNKVPLTGPMRLTRYSRSCRDVRPTWQFQDDTNVRTTHVPFQFIIIIFSIKQDLYMYNKNKPWSSPSNWVLSEARLLKWNSIATKGRQHPPTNNTRESIFTCDGYTKVKVRHRSRVLGKSSPSHRAHICWDKDNTLLHVLCKKWIK
jgi:hypothetical protein